ncbi:cupredoxin domain-containing protein [Bacillus timonensis]|nr:cupredoxin domain-containing protein [Bacillus timonensis]
MRFVVIKRNVLVFIALCSIIAFCSWFVFKDGTIPTIATLESTKPQEETHYVINMVTGEFSSKTAEGKKIEAYRWDPGTIFVPEGKEVTLRIYGVNGEEHPFYIEGTKIKGTVKKGKETIITHTFEKEGMYRLICLAHPDIANNGPMIAYIVVD